MKRSYILALLSASLSSLAQATEIIYAIAAVQYNGELIYTGSDYSTKLTPLGKQQLYDVATFYHDRYMNDTSSFYIDGIHSSFDDSQVYAMAPDQSYLVTSGQVFLQGLFPPQKLYTEVTLSNGQIVKDPPNGVQFTTLHSVSPLDPDTIWLDAGDGCPNYQDEGTTFLQSSEFLRIKTDSQSFYDSLIDQYLAGVFSLDQIGYQSAFEIYNFMSYGFIYNSTFMQKIDPQILYHLKTLADSYEWAMNGNVSLDNPALTVYGKALANKITECLTINYDTAGAENKFTLLVSSYESFLGFFGHAGLSDYSDDFKGLPNYAATMIFELFSDADNPSGGYPSESVLRVRFLFRNGTDDSGPLLQFPIFGMTDMGLLEFQEKINEFAVKDTAQWCELCSSHVSFCSENETNVGDVGGSETNAGDVGGSETNSGEGDIPTDISTGRESRSHSLSPAIAGVIGAICVIVAVLLGLGVAMLLFGLRFVRTRRATTERGFRGGEKLPSEIDLSKIPPSVLKV